MLLYVCRVYADNSNYLASCFNPPACSSRCLVTLDAVDVVCIYAMMLCMMILLLLNDAAVIDDN